MPIAVAEISRYLYFTPFSRRRSTLMTCLPLAFSTTTARVRLTYSKSFSPCSFPAAVSFGFSAHCKLVCPRLTSSLSVRGMAELVQDKEPVAAATSVRNEKEANQWKRSELNHPRTFLDARSEKDILSGIKKEAEAGRLPPNVALGMEELYHYYKKAVLRSGDPSADETVLSNTAVAFDRFLLEVEDPFIFSSYHKAIREPFDYYMFGQNFIRPLIDFKNSYIGNLSLFYDMEKKLQQGHNIVLMSNHQTEADPAIISLLLEATNPCIAEDMKFVAGDRVVTDPLCIPFSMGRNLICVYSKNHMFDDPELVGMKRRANTRSLKEMALLLRGGSQIVWIAPSGGRDRPDPLTKEWHPAPFDSSSADNMRRLVEHSGVPGHIYPLALSCHEIMPPPPRVEKEIGEKRMVSFHGTGLSVAPEIDFSDFMVSYGKTEEAKEAYSQALYKSVTEHYKVLRSAINGTLGVKASSRDVILSQPWGL